MPSEGSFGELSLSVQAPAVAVARTSRALKHGERVLPCGSNAAEVEFGEGFVVSA